MTRTVSTDTFYCEGPADSQHPRVYYTMPPEGQTRCGYCNELFVNADFHTVMQQEQAVLDLSTQESRRQRQERIKKHQSE